MTAVLPVADPVASLKERVDALYARLPAPREQRAATRVEAQALAAELERLVEPPPELAYTVVKLLRKAGSLEAALALLQRRRPLVPAEPLGPSFYEMELSFSTGRMEDGQRLLAGLEGAKLRPSWSRAIERIQQRVRDADAARQAAPPADPAVPAAPIAPPAPPSLLDRVQRSAERFPVKEAGRYAARVAAEMVLADYAQEPDPSDELTFAVIRLLVGMKRYPDALALMLRRRPRIEAKARDIDLHEIYLHYRVQQHEEADALLQRFIEAGHKASPHWKRVLAKMLRKREGAGARDAFGPAEHSLCELQAQVDLTTHLPLVRALLPGGNDALETLLFIDRRLRALGDAASAAAPDLRVFDKYHRARLILSCGFSWSGSGAVSCYLEQHEKVWLPFGRTEMAYLQGRDGRRGIYAFLEAGALTLEAMRRRLARFLMESIVSLRRQHYSVLKPCLQGERGCAGVLGQLIDDFNVAMLSAPALDDVEVRRQLTGKFIQRMFSVRGGSHVLLNNVFLAPRTGLLGALDDAIFIVVQRDARDQYVARRMEASHARTDGVEVFGAMLRNNRGQFLAHVSQVPANRLQEQLMLIRFEDFVRDEALKLHVLERAGLPASGLAADRVLFDPSVSARNIGIHAGALSAEEITYIENELGIYLP